MKVLPCMKFVIYFLFSLTVREVIPFLTDSCERSCWSPTGGTADAASRCDVENYGAWDPEDNGDLFFAGIETVSRDVILPPLPTMTIREEFVEDAADQRCETKVRVDIHVSNHESRSAVEAYMVWVIGLSGPSTNSKRFILLNMTQMTEQDWLSLGDLTLTVDCFETATFPVRYGFRVAQFPHYENMTRDEFEIKEDYDYKELTFDERNPNNCIHIAPTTGTTRTLPEITESSSVPPISPNAEGSKSGSDAMETWAVVVIILVAMLVLMFGVVATAMVVYFKKRRDKEKEQRRLDYADYEVGTFTTWPCGHLHSNRSASKVCPDCHRNELSELGIGDPSKTYTHLNGYTATQSTVPTYVSASGFEPSGWFQPDLDDEKQDSGFSQSSRFNMMNNNNLDPGDDAQSHTFSSISA